MDCTRTAHKPRKRLVGLERRASDGVCVRLALCAVQSNPLIHTLATSSGSPDSGGLDNSEEVDASQ